MWGGLITMIAYYCPEFASVTDGGDWSKQSMIPQRDPQIPVDVYLAGNPPSITS